MAERGIDISNEFPKPWTDETVRKRYESWDGHDDPAGLDTRSDLHCSSAKDFLMRGDGSGGTIDCH
jgi:hypothetical protein